jgi:hypothetical protein
MLFLYEITAEPVTNRTFIFMETGYPANFTIQRISSHFIQLIMLMSSNCTRLFESKFIAGAVLSSWKSGQDTGKSNHFPPLSDYSYALALWVRKQFGEVKTTS